MSTLDICKPSDMKDAIKDEGNDLAPEVSSNGPALQNVDKKQASPQDNEEANITFHISKKIRIRIYKPLIPLKIVLFCWYGGGSFVAPFLFLHLKQQGLTLQELSFILTLSPIAQFLGTVFSGVLADKLGRSKPILIGNLVFSILILGGVLLVPPLEGIACSREINLKCDPIQFDRLITRTSCEGVEDDIEVSACNVQCPENVTEHCHGNNLICEILAGEEELRNFSLSIHVQNRSAQIGNRCFYNVSSMAHGNETYSWCNVNHKRFCRVTCFVESGIRCDDSGDDRHALLMTVMLLILLFMTTYSNVYRFMDVTAMSLVKEHQSDFGRERFFSVVGILFVSPIAGLVVKATTPDGGGDKNYSASFYLFGVMVLLVLATVYKLKVRINSPGKKMWKKTTFLLKNLDVVSFALVLFVLGISWSFTKNFMFWYLEEELKAPSLLIGLIPAISALYGLPFLATSRWWVQKIGPTHIFVLGLIGYVINSTGYSFLTDPWFSLILEATNILTYHLLWVAIITYSHELAPEGLTATVIAVAGSIHYHLGKSFGSLIGGSIMDKFGGRIAFRVMGIICLIFAVIYSLYLYIRRKFFMVNPQFVEPGPEDISSGVPMCMKTKD